MLTSQEIKEITFSSAVGGYKKDEVDVFLDSVESDYIRFERVLAERDARIRDLEEKLQGVSRSQESINNVLFSAQRVADQITEEAKAKADEMIQNAQNEVIEINEKSRALSSEFESVSSEKKSRLENEIASMLNEAKEKKIYIENATTLTVKKQQELFDKLKEEILAFRAEITDKYKEHLKLLSEMQIVADVDPEEIAKAIEENALKETEAKTEETEEAEELKEIVAPEEETAETDFDLTQLDNEKFEGLDEEELESLDKIEFDGEDEEE